MFFLCKTEKLRSGFQKTNWFWPFMNYIQVTLMYFRRKTDASIYKVTDEILTGLVRDHEYVAVYFSGPGCKAKKTCQRALAQLETIDDDVNEIGIIMVTLEDTGIAEKNGTNCHT